MDVGPVLRDETKKLILTESITMRLFLRTSDGETFHYLDPQLKVRKAKVSSNTIWFLKNFKTFLTNLQLDPREYFKPLADKIGNMTLGEKQIVPLLSPELFCYMESWGICVRSEATMVEEIDSGTWLDEIEVQTLRGYGINWQGEWLEGESDVGADEIKSAVSVIESTLDSRTVSVVSEIAWMRCMVRTTDGFKMRYSRGANKGALYVMSEWTKGAIYGYQAYLRNNGINPEGRVLALYGTGWSKDIQRSEWRVACRWSVIPIINEAFVEWLSQWLIQDIGKIMAWALERFSLTTDRLSLFKDERAMIAGHGHKWQGGTLLTQEEADKYRALGLL